MKWAAIKARFGDEVEGMAETRDVGPLVPHCLDYVGGTAGTMAASRDESMCQSRSTVLREFEMHSASCGGGHSMFSSVKLFKLQSVVIE